MAREYRQNGIALLHGEGIEIGALHEPTPLPPGLKVRYADAITRSEALKLFPEVEASRMVEPDQIVNLDYDALAPFPDASADFIIISHVLEHLANPLGTIADIFRVLRPGGHAVIAIPDKRFTFDRNRAPTSFEHVWEDYVDRTKVNSDEHYVDFLRGVWPLTLVGTPAEIAGHVAHARSRREHCHVWTSDDFRELMLLTLPLTLNRASLEFESAGDANQFEYYSVWKKAIPDEAS